MKTIFIQTKCYVAIWLVSDKNVINCTTVQLIYIKKFKSSIKHTLIQFPYKLYPCTTFISNQTLFIFIHSKFVDNVNTDCQSKPCLYRLYPNIRFWLQIYDFIDKSIRGQFLKDFFLFVWITLSLFILI